MSSSKTNRKLTGRGRSNIIKSFHQGLFGVISQAKSLLIVFFCDDIVPLWRRPPSHITLRYSRARLPDNDDTLGWSQYGYVWLREACFSESFYTKEKKGIHRACSSFTSTVCLCSYIEPRHPFGPSVSVGISLSENVIVSSPSCMAVNDEFHFFSYCSASPLDRTLSILCTSICTSGFNSVSWDVLASCQSSGLFYLRCIDEMITVHDWTLYPWYTIERGWSVGQFLSLFQCRDVIPTLRDWSDPGSIEWSDGNGWHNTLCTHWDHRISYRFITIKSTWRICTRPMGSRRQVKGRFRLSVLGISLRTFSGKYNPMETETIVGWQRVGSTSVLNIGKVARNNKDRSPRGWLSKPRGSPRESINYDLFSRDPRVLWTRLSLVNLNGRCGPRPPVLPHPTRTQLWAKARMVEQMVPIRSLGSRRTCSVRWRLTLRSDSDWIAMNVGHRKRMMIYYSP